MRIGVLAIDTSGTAPSVAIGFDESDAVSDRGPDRLPDREIRSIAAFTPSRIVAERLPPGGEIAESLIPSLRALSLDPASDIRAVVVCSGPGSYTGTRNALSFAIALRSSLGIPLYGLSSFGALVLAALNELRTAGKLEGSERRYGVILPANRNEVFVGVRTAVIGPDGTASLRTDRRCDVVPLTALSAWKEAFAGSQAGCPGEPTILSHGEPNLGTFCGIGAEALLKAFAEGRTAIIGESFGPDAATFRPGAAFTPWYEKEVVAKTLAERGVTAGRMLRQP